MTEENDGRHAADRTKTGRRAVLAKGLGAAGAALSPVGAAGTAAAGSAQSRLHRFEIRAAADVEFTYHLKVDDPVSAVTRSDSGAGAEPGGNDSVEELDDGTVHVEGITGLGQNDIWEFKRLLGFWATTTRDGYALFMDGEPFQWYGLDTRLPVDFRFFEIRAQPGVETFEYEFTALTNATNLGSPADAAAELFGNDFVVERGDGARVRGKTGRGKSDTWLIGWAVGDPEVAVTDFSATASRDEYTLFYGDSEIAVDEVA